MAKKDAPEQSGGATDSSVTLPNDSLRAVDAPSTAPSDSLAVDAWGLALFPPTDSGRPHPDAWKHAAAAALHHWPLYAHNNNAPMALSRADYEAALQAATAPDKTGAYTPHGPAFYGEVRK